MRKLLLVSLLLPCVVHAQGVSHVNIALYNSGGAARVVPSAFVTVCGANDPSIPCTTTVSLFTNYALTQSLANPFNADANGNFSFMVTPGNYTVTVTGFGVIGYSYQISLIGPGVGTPNTWTALQTFNAGITSSGPNTLAGTTTFSGNVTATVGQNAINAYSFNKIIYVDGIHFTTLASALATVPSTGAIVVDTFVEAFTSNPVSGVTNPFWLQFGPGAWTTTAPVVLGANQWLTGAGPQQTQIKAVAGFSSSTQGVVTMGIGGEIHSSFVRDIGIACNGVATCTGIVIDGAQNPSGVSNVVVTNYTADGIRIQMTSAPSGAISLRDIWTYAQAGVTPSGNDLHIHQFVGELVVDNFVGAVDHTHTGAAGFFVEGGVGNISFNACGSEGVTDMYLLSAPSADVTIANIQQNAGSTPGVNVVHVTAGFSGQYTLINVNQGTSTGAALVDDIRTYSLTGGIGFFEIAGGTSLYQFGTPPSLQWIRSPLTTTQSVDLIKLPTSYVGTQQNYRVQDPSAVCQFCVSNDGRIQFRGNQTGAFAQILASDTLTASRTVQYPNGPSAPVVVAALVTTAAASDNVTVQGMTASGHCTLTPTNAAASGAASEAYVSAKAANQITVTHAVTANMNYDVMCTSN
jgi:hypothetical protein